MRCLNTSTRPLVPKDVIGDVVGAFREVTAAGESFHAVGVFVHDAEVIVDVAVLGIGALNAAAGSRDADRRFRPA